ncbi:three-Cys-motif partner protein TcmP [Chloracidobacterium thermophilum]|uniref:three-Cys-motif partner protein TcmP n=1 Tax=Chloracidobacterium thermophilum TaxID=458033 RepID=UPI000738B7C0|nr:three-Cys-motif partner protein TcmP [Chloracidobacterium thermophilum]
MKTSHTFGGDWTEQKLERLQKYLKAYTTIFTKNKRAQKLIPIYVDAFAGTGYRTKPLQLTESLSLFEEFTEPEVENFLKGSAWLALEVKPSFQKYIFIEQNTAHVKELQKLQTIFSGKQDNIQIIQSDANNWLQDWCRDTDWKTHRAVVFLDPYGMQVEWKLIEALAKTKAIDLWLLFPIGVAVNRLLTKGGKPPLVWEQTLTRVFGTEDWRDNFYSEKTETTLFGDNDVTVKEADFAKIGEFFVNRLKTVFSEVAENPLPLRNSQNTILYLLCFAAGNPTGAKTAVRIAQHILKP